MRVAVIYKIESDHAREVLDYLRDFARQTGHAIEEIDPDTPEGAHFFAERMISSNIRHL